MTIHTREVGEAILLSLNVPPMNTLGIEQVQQLKRFFQEHPNRKPLVITGTGPAFSAGVDTKLFASYNTMERAQLFEEITGMTAAIMSISAPVVAAVNGHAMGGGMVLVLCTDYRVVVEGNAKFGLTEASAGIAFPQGPAAVISHELGPNLLRRLTLASCIVKADDLIREGVFDEVVEADRLIDTALQRAAFLAKQPAFSDVKLQVRGKLATLLEAMTSDSAPG
ncbi:MAG: enoyl-CoA hydratase/isomerase family protein [Pseudomonadota bacterium]